MIGHFEETPGPFHTQAPGYNPRGTNKLSLSFTQNLHGVLVCFLNGHVALEAMAHGCAMPHAVSRRKAEMNGLLLETNAKIAGW